MISLQAKGCTGLVRLTVNIIKMLFDMKIRSVKCDGRKFYKLRASVITPAGFPASDGETEKL